MKWRDRPVLVTGATGLLGVHLGCALVSRFAQVVAIVRDDLNPLLPRLEPQMFKSKGPAFIRVNGDVTDQALVERVLAEYDIQTVFHLAAQTQVQVANKSPVGTFDSNIRGTWSVLEACRRVGVEQIVVASSDKAYGADVGEPYTEATPLNPVYPYDVSKACADLIARSYADTYAMPICVTRCGNLFGPGDLNWQRLIPGTMRSLLRGEIPVIRSDGTLKRDYFYVKDAAEAYLHLAEQMAKNRALFGQAFNFAGGEVLSVLDMVSRIGQAIGISGGEVHIENTAKGEILNQSLDCYWAKKALDWRPVLDLNRALAETADWYRAYLKEPAHENA